MSTFCHLPILSKWLLAHKNKPPKKESVRREIQFFYFERTHLNGQNEADPLVVLVRDHDVIPVAIWPHTGVSLNRRVRQSERRMGPTVSIQHFFHLLLLGVPENAVDGRDVDAQEAHEGVGGENRRDGQDNSGQP